MSVKQLSYKTKPASPATINREWWVADATNQTLGRFCSRIAVILRGKHKATYTPHFDAGDFVIVLNSGKIKLSGNKLEVKEYQHFTGYPDGRKVELAKDLIKRRPNNMIERGVKGMLPKNRLGRAMVKKLFVYEGDTHPHAAQKPKALTF